jgi:hypothetical protein
VDELEMLGSEELGSADSVVDVDVSTLVLGREDSVLDVVVGKEGPIMDNEELGLPEL